MSVEWFRFFGTFAFVAFHVLCVKNEIARVYGFPTNTQSFATASSVTNVNFVRWNYQRDHSNNCNKYFKRSEAYCMHCNRQKYRIFQMSGILVVCRSSCSRAAISASSSRRIHSCNTHATRPAQAADWMTILLSLLLAQLHSVFT